MGIRERLAQLLLPERKAQGGIIPGLVGLQTPSVPVYSDMTVRRATREGYKISVYVYRAVRTIVAAGSGIPWMVLDREGEEILDHPFTRVLRRPNPAMSGQDLMELLMAHLLLPGNALWQPLVVGGQIRELWPVMPDKVRPIPSKQPGEWLEAWEIEGQRHVPPETFIHFQQFDPGNPYWGTGPLLAAARTIDTDNEALDTQKISMQNRAIPDGIFTPNLEVMTREQFAEANRQIAEVYTAKGKRRAPWVITAKYQQMALSPVEMDYIASRLANKQDIAAAFGIDSAFLGDKSASTYNNLVEMKRSLYEQAVLPMLDDIKATMNLRIAPLYGDIEIAYDTSGVAALREDYTAKAETAARLWSLGVPMSMLNTTLELGLEEYEGWDVSYLPMNVVPADMVGAEPEPVPEEPEPAPDADQPKSLNVNTEEQKALFWKRIDTRRQAYWNVVAKRLSTLYGAGGDAVVRAVRNAPMESAENQAEAAITSLRPRWEKTLRAICMALVEDFGNQTAADLGGKPKAKPGDPETKDDRWVFDPFNDAVKKWLAEHVTESVTLILRSEANRVSRIIEEGRAANATIDEVARSLRDFYDGPQARFNAMRTARTEVHAAAGFGQREAALQSKWVKTHQWISSRDDRVRDAHQDIDGEEVPINQKYSNGLWHPGDTSGDPAEFVMCRCAEVWH